MEFPPGIWGWGIPAAGGALRAPTPTPPEFPRDFPAVSPTLMDFHGRLKAENWEFRGIFGNSAPPSASPGVGKALFPPGEFPKLSPNHSSPELGFFPISSPFFSGFSPKFLGCGRPGSAQMQAGAAWNSGSVPALGLGSSRGFASPKFGNLSPKFQAGSDLGLKFQNILERYGVRKENLDFLAGIWEFQPFPSQENSTEKDSKELLHPRGNKKLGVCPPKESKTGKTAPVPDGNPQIPELLGWFCLSGIPNIPRNPQEPLEFPMGIPALDPGWKIPGFGNFGEFFFPMFLSSNGTEDFP